MLGVFCHANEIATKHHQPPSSREQPWVAPHIRFHLHEHGAPVLPPTKPRQYNTQSRARIQTNMNDVSEIGRERGRPDRSKQSLTRVVFWVNSLEHVQAFGSLGEPEQQGVKYLHTTHTHTHPTPDTQTAHGTAFTSHASVSHPQDERKCTAQHGTKVMPLGYLHHNYACLYRAVPCVFSTAARRH